MPGGTQRMHAVAAGLVLFVLVADMILPRHLAVPVKAYQQSYLHLWAFRLLFALAVDVSFFWPFGTQRDRLSN